MAHNESDPDFFDVIVAGGGPAGSSAAYFLAEAGKRILVLEKEKLPRYKTCGGGVSSRFLREQFPFSFDPVLKTAVTSVSYVWGSLDSTIPVSPGAISVVMRDELDEYLLRQVKGEVIQGAAVRTVREGKDRVDVETRDGRRFCASYLIGADGANSVVAHSLGLRPRRFMVAAIEAEVPASQELMRRFGHQMVFIFNEIRYGYLWIFPKQDHLSVGIASLRPRQGELQKKLKKVMAHYGISLENIPIHGHPIPIFTRPERVSSSRTLLVGDAAGLADPFSGEGIRFAIKSGRLAAESILSGHLERYQKALHRTIGFSHSQAALISILFNFFPAPFLLFGTPNPFSTYGVIEMLSDHMTTIEFFALSVATLPIFLFTETTAGLLQRIGQSQLAHSLRAAVYPKDVNPF